MSHEEIISTLGFRLNNVPLHCDFSDFPCCAYLILHYHVLICKCGSSAKRPSINLRSTKVVVIFPFGQDRSSSHCLWQRCNKRDRSVTRVKAL